MRRPKVELRNRFTSSSDPRPISLYFSVDSLALCFSFFLFQPWTINILLISAFWFLSDLQPSILPSDFAISLDRRNCNKWQRSFRTQSFLFAIFSPSLYITLFPFYGNITLLILAGASHFFHCFSIFTFPSALLNRQIILIIFSGIIPFSLPH